MTRFSRWAGIALAIGLIAICAIGGGSARVDVTSLLIVRSAAVLTAAAMMLLPRERGGHGGRAVLWFLSILSLWMIAQAIPLPPAIWLSLPGHERFGDAAAAAGIAQPWRPISVTPDLTLSALADLVVPVAVALSVEAVRPRDQHWILAAILAFGILSCLVGVVQVATGGLHYYIYHHLGATGLFANRNHQGAFLALCLPLLAVWRVEGTRHLPMLARNVLASAAAALFVVMIVVGGSRAGLLLGAIGAVGFVALATGSATGARIKRRWIIAAAVVLACVAVLVLFGRATALDRLFATGSIEGEARFDHTPLVVRIIRDFMPFGSGFGSFDPVFRIYEPDNFLNPGYFNHAHNDYLELVLTGGVPGALIFAGFGIYVVRRLLPRNWSAREPADGALWRRASALALAILLLHSGVDYPLRVPSLAAVATCLVIWCLMPYKRRMKSTDRLPKVGGSPDRVVLAR
ncbi:O-antigen ligase family protein [Sphingomonas tabacisoli]|uniref:O-antigen ligase family protein n=1 Tax=Sphingomonas tabacisoli TaxID=2249466 RepID=A0ABW4I3U8_9SPHN